MSDVGALLAQAAGFQKAGDLAQAEALYLDVLDADPSNRNALHLLGVIRYQQGRNSEALDLIGRVLGGRPDSAAVRSNYGLVLKALGRLEEALESFDTALAIQPGYGPALSNRALTLLVLKRFDAALADFDSAVAAAPGAAEMWNGRGVALRGLGRFDEALACHDRTLALQPDHVEALVHRAVVLRELGRLDQALASFDAALAIRPDHVEALHGRAAALRRLKRLPQALESLEKAIAQAPRHREALHDHGVVLADLHRFDEALESYGKALALDPAFVPALVNQANLLQTCGQPEQAVAGLQQALAIAPGDAGLHSNLIFSMNFDPAITEQQKQQERARWQARHAQHPIAARRLRIGYVSGHFRRQSATYCFGGVILNHDPDAFEVFCYSDTETEDDVTALLRRRADQWHDTRACTDEELANLVRFHRIDILVDLVGHMVGHRLGVFARKPAPVQVTAWGEPTGTGVAAMDYLMADAVLVPDSMRPLLCERVIELPGFLGYWSPEVLPQPGPLPALERGHITFGSCNRLEKLTAPTLECWAAILSQVKTARLILKDAALDAADQCARIRTAFRSRGIDEARLTLLGSSSRQAHFAAYQGIDIALDPFPHGGGMTTLDALWMGVPVIAWAGPTISSRLAAANLTALGLAGFVADDPDGYVALAVQKAAGLAELAALRADLRGRLAASEIGDSARYCRAVEKAYRQMWSERGDQPPTPRVPPLTAPAGTSPAP